MHLASEYIHPYKDAGRSNRSRSRTTDLRMALHTSRRRALGAPLKFRRHIHWLALPEEYRDLSTESALAHKLGGNRTALYGCKKGPYLRSHDRSASLARDQHPSPLCRQVCR